MKIRPATGEDAAAVAEVFAAVEADALGRPSHFSEYDVRDWWVTVPLETNTWLVEDDGSLVAAAGGEVRGGRGVFAGAVRPAARGRGLGTTLAELAEARLAGDGAGRIHAWTVAGDEAADELFAGRGYREVRRFWEMAIELDEEPPPPLVPVESFRLEDVRAFHTALEESFEDHWESHPEPFERWWERQQGKAGYDPSLWFVVRDGDEIAGAVRNDLNGAAGGYVGSLGVRRKWRGRGYGRALLLRSFREFRRRGLTRVTLGVDAANPTGATRLYESVGMHVDQESIIWEKVVA